MYNELEFFNGIGCSMKSIGWVNVDADGKPIRNIRSGGTWRERKEPIKVYATQQVANRYGRSVEVFIKEDGDGHD